MAGPAVPFTPEQARERKKLADEAIREAYRQADLWHWWDVGDRLAHARRLGADPTLAYEDLTRKALGVSGEEGATLLAYAYNH